MRRILIASAGLIAFTGAAMAQAPTAATGPTNGVAGSPPPAVSGIQSSNGAGVGTNGGIKGGVGMTETTSTTTGSGSGGSATPTSQKTIPGGTNTEGGSTK